MSRIAVLCSLLIICVNSQCNSFNFAGLGSQAYFSDPGQSPSGSVTASGNTISMGYNNRGYVTNTCVSPGQSYAPTDFQLLYLLNTTLSVTVDLSAIGCGCNAAFYLVNMPGRNSDGSYAPGSSNDYYCDANDVSGTWCPEMDLMEANTGAYQITPHKCSAPNANGYYSSCDTSGCYERVYSGNNYGFGTQYEINTQNAFSVSWSFEVSGGQFTAMVTKITQGSNTLTFTHNDASCGSGYLESMTQAFSSGMVIVVSYWGSTSSGSDMSWLDSSPAGPCNPSTGCAGTGSVVFSNLAISGVGVVAPPPPPPAPQAPQTPPSPLPPPGSCIGSVSGGCSLFTTSSAPDCPFIDSSYGYTPSYSDAAVSLEITSDWNALYLSCSPASSPTSCITISSSSVLSFSAYGGSGTASQIVQVIISKGTSTIGSTVQVTLTPQVWQTYSVTVSQLGIASDTSISGVQLQAYSSAVNEADVLFRDIAFSNANCGQTVSSSTPTPSPPTPTPTPTPKTTPTPTPTPKPTPPPTTPTPTPTPKPPSTTPTPTPTPKPTPPSTTPTPSPPTPKPTPTPPPPTPTPSPPTPKPTPTPPPPTPTPPPSTSSCTLYGTSTSGPTSPFENWSYGYTPSFSGGVATLAITSSWNALYLACPSGNCISVSTSTTLSFQANGGTGTGGNQEIQVLAVSGSSVIATTPVTLTEDTTATYTLSAAQLGITSSVSGLSGVQFQAYSSQINQAQVTLSNIVFSNAGCGQSSPPPEDEQATVQFGFSETNVTHQMSVSSDAANGMPIWGWVGVGVGILAIAVVVIVVVVIFKSKGGHEMV